MNYIFTGLIFMGACITADPVFAATTDSAPVLFASGSSAITTAEPETTIGIDSSATASQQQSAQVGVIKVIRIVGATTFKEAELLKLLQEYLGKKNSYAELEKAAGRISAYYQARGHSALVSMPRQDISEGIVLYYLIENYNDKKSPLASDEKTTWQKLATRNRQPGPLTRALYGQFAHGAYYLISPSLTVHQEFNDNIFETRSSHKADLMTSVAPAISIQYHAKRLDCDFNYSPTYQTFLNNSGRDELIQSARLEGKFSVIDNFLYLNIFDSYRRTSVDPNRENLFTNQTDVNSFSISPYITYHLNPRWTADGGYIYSNLSTPGTALSNIQSNAVFLSLTRQMSATTRAFMGADGAQIESGDSRFSRVSHFVGLQHTYSAGSSVSAKGGYSLFLPQSGSSSISPYWDIDLGYSWRSYSLNVSTGILYDNQLALRASETMYAKARLARKYHRGVIGVFARYSQVTNNQLGTSSSKWFSNGADATYELTSRATASASMITDKYQHEQQYHNSYTLGINYLLAYDLSLTASYGHLAFSDIVFAPTGATEVNRIDITVTKSF
jgi:hypothetical protein